MRNEVEKIMHGVRLSDRSFTERGFMGFAPRYSQSEVRDIWMNGIRHGVELGLLQGSLEGQAMDLEGSIKDDRVREFYDKFLGLCVEYGCAIQYHPLHGLVVIDTNYR